MPLPQCGQHGARRSSRDEHGWCANWRRQHVASLRRWLFRHFEPQQPATARDSEIEESAGDKRLRAAQHAKGKIWPEIPIILLVSTSSRRAVIHPHPPTPTRPQSKHDAGRRLHHPRHLWRDQGGPPGALVISSLRAPAGSAACWLRNALAMPAISLPYPEPEPSVREAGKTLPTVSAFTRSQVTVIVTLVAPPPSPLHRRHHRLLMSMSAGHAPGHPCRCRVSWPVCCCPVRFCPDAS
jgi:hypothetical protein